MFPIFSRNKHVGTENVAGGLRVRTTLEETFFSAEVEVGVRLPTLEITSVKGQMRRGITPQCWGALSILHKVVGERVSEGLTRRVDDLIGRADGCTHMTNLVLESCHAAALGFRQVKMAEAEAQGLSHEDFYAEWVRTRPKELINSCVAFAEDSPLLAKIRQDLAAPSRPRMRAIHQIGPGILRFSRNKLLKVARAAQDMLLVRGILEDNAHSMMVEMEVGIPQMEIVRVQGQMVRVPNEVCPWGVEKLQNAVGLRIARGLTATVDEVVGRQGCPHMANLLLEGCHAAIQGMLGVQLEESHQHRRDSHWDEARRRWAESLPFLPNSCLAYQDGSPLVGKG